MLRSSLCSQAITGEGTDDATKQTDEIDKGVILKNCAQLVMESRAT